MVSKIIILLKKADVEAVRYNHLLKSKNKKVKSNILIIGDMNNYENHFAINQIEKIKHQFSNKVFYYKPHPSNTIKMISDQNN